jgi:hypothetical protein
MSVAFVPLPPPNIVHRALTEADAIDIWIARWLRVRRKDLLARYGCDPRRLYEIWEGTRFPASREKALNAFATRYPTRMTQSDLSPHKRIPTRTSSPDQLQLFD